jgi:hypothetical protein
MIDLAAAVLACAWSVDAGVQAGAAVAESVI